MLEPRLSLLLRGAIFGRPILCAQCHVRTLAVSARRRAAAEPSPAPAQEDSADGLPPKVLKPLARPIGLHLPPQPGQNTGVDTRSIAERSRDLVDREKNLARRAELTRQVAKPYYRKWKVLNRHRGKTFLAPARLFRAERALYFPNLRGATLASSVFLSNHTDDTTPALRGRVSVVAVYRSQWGEQQARSFVAPAQNPALAEALAAHRDAGAQLAEICVEEDTGRAWLVRLFARRLRRVRTEEEWARWFLIRQGLTDDLRDRIGCVHQEVGYVYLLDWECRIRWAGTGDATEEERGYLVQGVRRLAEEHRRLMAAAKTDKDDTKKTGRQGVKMGQLGTVQTPKGAAINASA